MANDSSASVRETPHVNQNSRTNTFINAVKERAQAVLNDQSIDAPSRAIIRYALETNDPLLPELVRRADAASYCRAPSPPGAPSYDSRTC